ncbi:MAG: hypothetical protein GY788_22370 [bacterium]|nr:hypothetical protein [bacterium]
MTEPASSRQAAAGLRPRLVVPADIEWIAEAALSWARTTRWVLKGMTPSPEMLSRLLWEDVTVQQILVDSAGPAALIQLHDVDFQSGYGYLGLVVRPPAYAELEALIAAFIQGCFADFPLRKLYIDMLEDVCSQLLEVVGSEPTLEARLEDHERLREGVFLDRSIYAFMRPGQ